MFSDLERFWRKLVDRGEAAYKEQERKDQEKIGDEGVNGEYANHAEIVAREVAGVVAYPLYDALCERAVRGGMHFCALHKRRRTA